MLALSKYFKQDIIDTNQTLKPILIITEPSDESVLFTLTQDKDDMLDSDGNRIRSISCISKISNVKISTDYDSKKLKINRLRCTLYNYYDVNTKLSEYINTNITNKNVYLFYKSPTTNVINLENELNDYDCALVYRGSISRINFNDTSLDLSVEDRTQIKIADKQVPYMSVDKLPLDIRERVLEEYDEDNTVVPMTFGKVDKAPVLPYLEKNNERMLNVLFDIQPTAGNYKTARIPSLLDNAPNDKNYYLYIKQQKEYVIWDHIDNTYNLQSTINSKAKVYNSSGFTNNYVVPELQSDSEQNIFNLWDVAGFHQRLVESVYASDGSILDVLTIEVDNLSNSEMSNIESINDNSGKEKLWIRQGDDISANATNFDTGLKESYALAELSYGLGQGRWVLLKLEKGVASNLNNIKIDGQYAGNTFLCSNWQMYQSEDNSVPNNSELPSDADRTGFFVTPISPSLWKTKVLDQLPEYPYGNTDLEDVQKALNTILFQTDEDLNEDYSNSELLDIYAPRDNVYLNSPIYLYKDEPTRGDTKYWGSYGSNSEIFGIEKFNNIQGLYYGESGSDERLIINEADAHDMIAIFEFHPPYWNNATYQQGLKMNNIGFLHSVVVENIQKEKIFASIVGRKNNFYTEQIPIADEIPEGIIIDLQFLQKGLDEQYPNYENILNGFYNIISNFANNNLNQVITQYEIDDNLNISYQSQLNSDDSAMWNSYLLFKDYLYKVFSTPIKLYNKLNVYQVDSPENYNEFWKETWLKSIAKKIYEYLYQQDIEYTESYNINFIQNPDIFGSNVIEIDLTDLIIRESPNWIDYQSENLDEWIGNFYAYFDEYISAISKALVEQVVPNTAMGYLGYMSNWDSAVAELPILTGFSDLQNTELFIEEVQSDLLTIAGQSLVFGETIPTTTDGVIKKPSDIVMNILTNEMEYAKYNKEGVVGNDVLLPDYNQFDMDSITESREAHNWNMGFSVDKKTDGKKLIEKILNESKSYPRFASDGKFGLLTIKESYTYDDIDTTIKLNDVISYSFKQTKREDILTSVKMFYRYDYGQKKYYHYHEEKIEDLLDGYTGMEMYNLDPTDSHKDINLKYHSDRLTVEDFAQYTLLNNCNPHNMVEMTLPLNYMNLSVGDKIHIPLINNEKIFNVDYSKVDFLNGQPIYPLWMIMETNVGTTSVKIKAYQLHYLGGDGNHQFEMPDTNYEVIGNTFEFSNYNYPNGDQIPNWNYNPNANVDNGYQIPYFDVTGDGFVNVNDIVAVVNHITGNTELNNRQKERLQYYSNGTLKTDNVVNVNDLVSLVNIITNE
tara:strand:+ start:15192 stop:19088 length:3897 start_codon:yes stop_codon:yes gene_type:complete